MLGIWQKSRRNTRAETPVTYHREREAPCLLLGKTIFNRLKPRKQMMILSLFKKGIVTVIFDYTMSDYLKSKHDSHMPRRYLLYAKREIAFENAVEVFSIFTVGPLNHLNCNFLPILIRSSRVTVFVSIEDVCVLKKEFV